ncbi:hypothetical protein [Nostoc sp.]|uniref:hypothetical protein n=1 Tax=Nostoc sp. TaxID=1180 RepID=UPI002FF51437
MDFIADEFIEFVRSGRVFNKQQTIKSLQNELIQPLIQRLITELKTLVLATGVILVTYRIVRHISGEHCSFVAKFHLEIKQRSMENDLSSGHSG